MYAFNVSDHLFNVDQAVNRFGKFLYLAPTNIFRL